MILDCGMSETKDWCLKVAATLTQMEIHARIIDKIMKNILDFPTNKLYHEINLIKLKEKIGSNCQIFVYLLTKNGFEIASDNPNKLRFINNVNSLQMLQNFRMLFNHLFLKHHNINVKTSTNNAEGGSMTTSKSNTDGDISTPNVNVNVSENNSTEIVKMDSIENGSINNNISELEGNGLAVKNNSDLEMETDPIKQYYSMVQQKFCGYLLFYF